MPVNAVSYARAFASLLSPRGKNVAKSQLAYPIRRSLTARESLSTHPAPSAPTMSLDTAAQRWKLCTDSPTRIRVLKAQSVSWTLIYSLAVVSRLPS